MSQPNVLLILTDDQRFDMLGAVSDNVVKTPNLDALTKRGVHFTHACIPGGTSGAVCMPARAMLHSGKSLFNLEGAGNTIPEDHALLGETFRNAGYATFGTGKWHNGKSAYHRSFTHGDEIFYGGMTDHWNVPAHHYDPSGKYDQTCLKTLSPFESKETQAVNCDHITAGRHSTDLLTDATLRFLKDRPSDKPFFTYVSYLAPHDPRTMPQHYRDMYNDNEIELPPNFCGGHPFETGALHIRDEMLGSFPRTPEETREHIADYYAMITHLDHEIGRLMEELKKQGILEDTIICFAGDNGLAVGQHGLMGKQNCYEHSIRVPLIFAGPGIPKDEKRSTFAYLMDVFPTLCDLAGLEIPEAVDSKSLLPAINNANEQLRNKFFYAYCDTQRSVRTAQYKLIEYAVEDHDRVTQLFDIQSDPWETENLAGQPEYTDIVTEMRKKLFTLADAWGDHEREWGQTFWRCYQT